MPLYEYRCGKCGRQFESYRRLADVRKDETCPACGGRAEKLGISLFTPKGGVAPGGSSCGGGPRRSPFG
jgi:putative FmdB family regulatory protein